MERPEPCVGCRREFPAEQLTFWLPKDDEAWEAWGNP